MKQDPDRGLYQNLSETDRARALGCLDAGMGSWEEDSAPAN